MLTLGRFNVGRSVTVIACCDTMLIFANQPATFRLQDYHQHQHHLPGRYDGVRKSRSAIKQEKYHPEEEANVATQFEVDIQ